MRPSFRAHHVAFALCAAAGASAQPCERVTSADEAAGCALVSSPEVLSARAQLEVLRGQKVTASLVLPSRPQLAASIAHRQGDGVQAMNWYLTLSQEIEIAGQRGLRLDQADAELAAQVRRVAALEREVTARVKATALRALAEGERAALATEAAAVAARFDESIAARSRESLASPVDADAVRAERVRLQVAAVEAKRAQAALVAEVQALLGETVTVALVGGIGAARPTVAERGVLLERALVVRGELAAAQAEVEAAVAQRALLSRARVPNLSLNVFAQNDGFNERVFGGGLSIPIPLPSPLAPNNEGERIAADARRTQAASELERWRRQVRLEVTRAAEFHAAAVEQTTLVPAELVERARQHLRSLAEALTRRELSVREAIVTQRTLLELLALDVTVRAQLALAAVEVERATGGAL